MDRALIAWRLCRGAINCSTVLASGASAISTGLLGSLPSVHQSKPSPQAHTPWLGKSGYSAVLGLRACATTTTTLPASLVQDALAHVNIVRLRQELEAEGEHNLSIPYSRFVDIAKECGAASDDEAAQQLRILQNAGVVFRYNSLVYLRGEEVADMIMLMLPGGKEDATAKLAKVEAELAELDKVHEQLERRSHRWADALLFCGLVVLFTQFVAFIWLTWWELSWDVMEPIAYIISLFYSLVAYIYFMFSRHTFDLEPFREHWSNRFKQKSIAKQQFDAERHEFLKKLQSRYLRHLRTLR